MKPAQHTVMLRQIAHGSAAYSAACALRNRVLRLPLGLDLYREDLAAEVSQLHFGLYDEADALLACLCQCGGRAPTLGADSADGGAV